MLEENLFCPFCNPEQGREKILENDNVYSTYDKFPVSKGHSLIIPKRHCGDYFKLTIGEQLSCWKMVNEVKTIINDEHHPDGFNVGINVNESAGQTVPHVHIHLIPRYKGDVLQPKGGIRGVIPERREY